MPKGPKYVDYLDEDPPISGQRFVILSFVGPERDQKCDVLGLKVRGVYDSIEETRQRAKEIQEFDSNFDIVVGQVGYWLPFNPDSSKIMDEEYKEEQLNELAKGYRKNRQLAKQHFNERKRQLMEEAMKEGTKEAQEEIANKKEHPISVKSRITTLTETIEELQTKLNETKENLEKSEEMWSSYTEEEKEEALKELEKLNSINSNDDEIRVKELQDLKSLSLEEPKEEKEKSKEETGKSEIDNLNLLENNERNKNL